MDLVRSRMTRCVIPCPLAQRIAEPFDGQARTANFRHPHEVQTFKIRLWSLSSPVWSRDANTDVNCSVPCYARACCDHPTLPASTSTLSSPYAHEDAASHHICPLAEQHLHFSQSSPSTHDALFAPSQDSSSRTRLQLARWNPAETVHISSGPAARWCDQRVIARPW